VSLDGVASLRVPAIAPPTIGFVGEGMPIPAYVETTSAGPTLTPFKLAALVSVTNELLASTSGETLIRQALIEAVGPALDTVLFSTNAATTAQPAGLRNSIAGLTPSPTGPGKEEILVNDLQAIATALGPVSGNGNIVLVASPDSAAALRMRLPAGVEWPVLTSASLAARTVIGVATNALVSAISGPPEIEASTQAAYVPDSAATEVVSSPGIVASAVTTVFQTDKTALKLRWQISWALRDARGLAWMTLVNW
jgi:hypothetical protein